MKNVLVIDDEPEIALLLTAILKNAGFNVRFALSAEKAEQALKHGLYHTVFLDINLGQYNGLSLMPQILDKNPGCDVVVITAQCAHEIAQEARAAGVSKFIFKPFSKADVMAVV